MKKRLSLMLVCSILSVVAEELPPAPQILAAARTQLPPFPVQLSGSLKDKAPNGFVRKSMDIKMTLDWNAQAPRADYKLIDGDTVQELSLTLGPDGMTSHFLVNGTATPFDPHAELIGSDVIWSDLTFAFLWNPNAKTVGVETSFGKMRYKITIPRSAGRTLNLWIEKESGRIRKAEERAADGDLEKVIRVVSVKNFDDLWMVKDLDIIRPQTGNRTSLRIDTVEAVKASAE